MRKLIVLLTIPAFLTACDPTKLVSSLNGTANKYQADLQMACNTAMVLSSLAPAISPWIVGGCGTAEAIDKLAADPSSLAWVNNLIAQAKGAAQANMKS